MSNRYQNKSKLIKLYRWLRYTPITLTIGVLKISAWILAGAKIPVEERDYFGTRWYYIKHLWTMYRCYADMKMQYYYSIDECIKELKSRG